MAHVNSFFALLALACAIPAVSESRNGCRIISKDNLLCASPVTSTDILTFVPRATSSLTVERHVGEGLELTFVFRHFPRLENASVTCEQKCRLVTNFNEHYNEPQHLNRLILQNVVFSAYTLDSFPGLNTLKLLHSNLQLSRESFRKLSKLSGVEISNNKPVELPDHVFSSQGMSLKRLIIRDNAVLRVTHNAFNNLKEMRKLILKSNNVTFLSKHRVEDQIPHKLFRDLVQLEYLDLSDSKLTALPKGIFANSKLLSHLDLSRNELHSLPSEIFKKNWRLRTLLIGGNRFRSLNFLNSLTRLRTLDVSHARIRNTDLSILSRCTTLRKLTMRGIPSVRFSVREIQQLPKYLGHLDLGDTNAISLTSETFHGFLNLTVLVMDNVGLKHMSFVPFSALQRLRYLDVSRNGLHKITEDFALFKGVLDLRDNPLHCNCLLQWMLQIETNRTLSKPDIQGATCFTPAKLRGREPSSISQSDMRCYPPEVTLSIGQ
ncbi:carboxypeptidase N subunit 2-like, partial [Lingula anatina]|uniref:Carboxypeptidase N subunit 2-like n=1 Tax=Lingula anatina TaxID=7574 RepID=A0A1S3IZB9_LINAN